MRLQKDLRGSSPLIVQQRKEFPFRVELGGGAELGQHGNRKSSSTILFPLPGAAATARAHRLSYFRFPALRQPQELIDYLGKRKIAIFSTDIDSLDFKMRMPEQVRQSVMEKLKKHGKGIVLVHDFQRATLRPDRAIETRLRGWACETRTQKRHRKLSL
jgi:hypothetical protein